MAPTDPLKMMDNIFQQVTTTDSVLNIANYLRNLCPKDLRETARASSLSSGQDPLMILNVVQNTLAVLYILCVFFAFGLDHECGVMDEH